MYRYWAALECEAKTWWVVEPDLRPHVLATSFWTPDILECLSSTHQHSPSLLTLSPFERRGLPTGLEERLASAGPTGIAPSTLAGFLQLAHALPSLLHSLLFSSNVFFKQEVITRESHLSARRRRCAAAHHPGSVDATEPVSALDGSPRP